jgi:hypothetical protein
MAFIVLFPNGFLSGQTSSREKMPGSNEQIYNFFSYFTTLMSDL